MAETTIVSWNLANWITVVLMVTVGIALLGVAAKLVQRSRGTSE